MNLGSGIEINFTVDAEYRDFEYEVFIFKPRKETGKKLETNKFKSIVKPLFENWTKNVFCNITLTKQRNELLPLLMNGQATVNYHFTL